MSASPPDPVTESEPAVAGRVRAWLEDPEFDFLTPGQRYTAVIVVVLAALMMSIGVPRPHVSNGRTSGGTQVQTPAVAGR